MGVRTSRWAEAWRDLTQSLRLTPFWMRLAYQRVRGRYQRLALGLIWHPLSYAFVVISLGLMWGAIMGREASYFMPYVAVSFATWFFIDCISIAPFDTISLIEENSAVSQMQFIRVIR